MRHNIRLALPALALATAQLIGCVESSTYTKVEPAHVEHQNGAEIIKLTLTDEAMQRLDVQTAPVQDSKSTGAVSELTRMIVPYSAIVYAPTGEAFVYASPEPRVFVRQPVEVDYIVGDVAVLKTGPAPGSLVASVGAAELLGTEIGVGH
jgi:hypothetical protein